MRRRAKMPGVSSFRGVLMPQTPPPAHDPAELVAAVLDALAAGDAGAAQTLAALAPTPDDEEGVRESIDWDETKHPRSDGGKFGTKGGGDVHPDLPPVLYRGGKFPGHSEGRDYDWTFWSERPEYAARYGRHVDAAQVAIRNPIDLRALPGAGEVDPADVAAALAEYGVEVDPSDLGRGEIHEVLWPARDEILDQATSQGYDGLVQNENHDGDEVTSWVSFGADQVRLLPPPGDAE